jgi:hypothetical protein
LLLLQLLHGVEVKTLNALLSGFIYFYAYAFLKVSMYRIPLLLRLAFQSRNGIVTAKIRANHSNLAA